MQYDFDKQIDRRGSGAIMTDCLRERYGREDILPLWIADMYFETPLPVREAIEKRLSHQIYGYAVAPESYWTSICSWERRIHGWKIERDSLCFIPGIVRGIAFVLQCFTAPGDKVVVQPPVYMPFLHLPENNGRKLVYNPLLFDEASRSYRMDLDGLEELCRRERPRLLILSNPHNPAGIVWPEADLARLAAICRREGVLVISDEIHSDMALDGSVHHPFPTVSEDAAAVSITFAAPSKTFNIAGIVSSYAVIPNATIRKRYFSWLHGTELNEAHLFAYIATTAAYRKGEAWRRQMIHAIEENVLFVEKYFAEKIPGIRPIRPQASFLVWLDCRELHLTHNELIDLFVDKAHLALNDGEMFGPGGQGFMRMNIGSPKAYIEKGLRQLEAAVRTMKQAKQ